MSFSELEYIESAAIRVAQPIADKDNSPWNRRHTLPGCNPRAASMGTSITGVLISGGRH